MLFLAPMMFFLVVAIYFIQGRPIFFVQQRPGLYGKSFKIIKLRTMLYDDDLNGKLFPNTSMITPFGHFLRSTSLDELPELWNVIKGEMSLVGPRPLMTEYLPLYNKRQARRHDVLPGITGWAQINGRNTISWEEKFQLDVWYVENKSFFLDLKILFLTFYNVALRKNIYDSENNIMPPFTGS